MLGGETSSTDYIPFENSAQICNIIWRDRIITAAENNRPYVMVRRKSAVWLSCFLQTDCQ